VTDDRTSRVLLQPQWVEVKPGVYLPRREGVA
jgi:hypothetical protein